MLYHGKLAIWALGILALTIPDQFAAPILVLFLSGAVTFAAWLVRTNQQTARTAETTAEILKNIHERVEDLEKWRIDELTRERDRAREENRR